MSYTYRIKCRLNEDGLNRAIKYIFLVIMHCIVSFFRDNILDLRFSGRLLRGNHKTRYGESGANDTFHTDYSVMPLIFNEISISPDDVLVDVGCGKGRVINYWLSKNLSNRIYGLELDPDIAARTAAQFANKKQVTIIPGDAIRNLPADGTVFYFYNPFIESKVREFEEKLRRFPGNIRVIYYNPKSRHIFRNEFWDARNINFETDKGIRRWGRLNKYHDLCIISNKKV